MRTSYNLITLKQLRDKERKCNSPTMLAKFLEIHKISFKKY